MFPTVVFVNMAKDVQLQSQVGYAFGQCLAAGTNNAGGRIDFVPDTRRGTVGDQHVGVFGNTGPAFGKSIAPFKIERPVEEHRRPWASPELQAFQFHRAVLQIMGMAYQFASFGRLILETPVVIAGNQDFVSVG